jgi:anti-sigma regulatory factor (Ser/Thr protein kinase)
VADFPDDDTTLLGITGDARREFAPISLLRQPAIRSHLSLFATGATNVDVVTGTSARLAIARHLRQAPGGDVEITLPARAEVAEEFLELLGQLPPETTLVGAVPRLHDPPRHVVLPATPVASPSEANSVAARALDACDRLGLPLGRANLVWWGIVELTANALEHASAADDPPFVAATIFGDDPIVEVAVSDLGRGWSETSDVSKLLAELPGLRGGEVGLADFIRRGAQQDVAVRLEVIAGTGRLRWTRTSHAASAAQWVPGTTVIARVAP